MILLIKNQIAFTLVSWSPSGVEGNIIYFCWVADFKVGEMA